MFLNINRLFVVIRELQKPIIFFRFIQIVGAFWIINASEVFFYL